MFAYMIFVKPDEHIINHWAAEDAVATVLRRHGQSGPIKSTMSIGDNWVFRYECNGPFDAALKEALKSGSSRGFNGYTEIADASRLIQ